jgi:hypothetical protein
MALNYLAVTACVAFGLASFLAVITWRRTLARLSLILCLGALFLLLRDSAHPWLAFFSGAACIAAVVLLFVKELGERRPTPVENFKIAEHGFPTPQQIQNH